MLNDLRVGQLVELTEDRAGTIRYVGTTAFSTGDWVGIELEEPVGKNNGSVKGKKYFECPADHGMFVRATAIVRIIGDPTPRQEPPTAVKDDAGSRAGFSRAPSALSRTGSFDPTSARRRSVNAGSPTPGARRSASRGNISPTKSNFSTSISSDVSSQKTSPTFPIPETVTKPTIATRPSFLARNASNVSQSSSISSRQRTSLIGIPTTRAARVGPARPLVSGHERGLSYTSTTSSVNPADSENIPEDDVRSSQSNFTNENSTSPGDLRVSISSHDTTENVDDLPVIQQDNIKSQGSFAGHETQAEPVQVQEGSHIVQSTSLPKPETNATSMGPPPPRRSADSRKVEELETKLRLLEKKRSEDREKLKSLERLQAERDRFESVIQKLQAKYQPQQQEMASLRRQLQDSQAKLSTIESMQGEHDTALEMATLDREMAEETAEALRTQLDALKEKADELEEEVKVLREENEEFGKEMSVEDRTSQGWLQMEKSNERLQEALLRLRDMSQSQETELKAQIASLQDDLKQFSGIKGQCNLAKEKLRQSDAVIEELRQQLDAALSAEDMVEELAEANLSLSEQLANLKVQIQDLEDLKELNDELEQGHIDAEKQLREELGYKDELLTTAEHNIKEQGEKFADQEYMLAKFRDLNLRLQGHIEDLNSSKQLTEAEAVELNNQSRAMANLNLKLQGSATKAQGKLVDIELRTLEAQEATEHLEIVNFFLPEIYKSERESVLAYLRFKRVAFKSRLLHGFLQESVNNTRRRSLAEEAGLLHNSLEKLTSITSICNWIINDIDGCTPASFTQYAANLHDLEPIERLLDQHIISLKENEIRLRPLVDDFQRFIPVLAHIAEIHNENSVESRAYDNILRTTNICANLGNYSFALECTKALLQRGIDSLPNHVEEGRFAVDSYLQQCDEMIRQAGSSKYIAGKALRSLEGLRTRSMTLASDAVSMFNQTSELVSQVSNGAIELWELLRPCIDEIEVEQSSELLPIISLIESSQLSSLPDHKEDDCLSVLASSMTTTSAKLNQILAISTSLNQTVEFTRRPPPWTIIASSIQSTAFIPPAITEELTLLKASLQARLADLHIRDRTVEEQNLKIELLESRMRDATAKAARIEELEQLLGKAVQRGEELAKEIEIRKEEANTFMVERNQLRAIVEENAEEGGGVSGAGRNVASAREVHALKLEIKDLQGAVRHLRQNRSRVRYSEEQMSWLSEPLVRRALKAEREAADAAEKEGLAVLGGLIDLVVKAKVVDLTPSLKGDRLAWRPAREKTAWAVARQREEWEGWRGRGRAFLRTTGLPSAGL